VGNLPAGRCGTIQVMDSVVCNDPDIRGLTQCTKVWITPANATTPAAGWDGSDVALKAKCLTNGRVRLGIYNTPWAMILSYTIFTLPFTVWVLTTFMRDLPVEIEEAAIVDGASPWVIITKVFMPLLWPALVTTGLLAFIGAWNEFLFALTFTISEDQRTVPVAIANFTGASVQEIPWGPIMAASVIVTVPLIVLVLIFQRKIVAGLTAGGVKG